MKYKQKSKTIGHSKTNALQRNPQGCVPWTCPLHMRAYTNLLIDI